MGHFVLMKEFKNNLKGRDIVLYLRETLGTRTTYVMWLVIDEGQHAETKTIPKHKGIGGVAILFKRVTIIGIGGDPKLQLVTTTKLLKAYKKKKN